MKQHFALTDLAVVLLLPAISACAPTYGADPLDSGFNTMPVVEANSQNEESSFHGEIGMEAVADF